MKRLIYTILLSLVICSCGSHKSNLKQETSINAESNHQRKDTASFREQVKKAEREDVTETVEEVITEVIMYLYMLIEEGENNLWILNYMKTI